MSRFETYLEMARKKKKKKDNVKAYCNVCGKETIWNNEPDEDGNVQGCKECGNTKMTEKEFKAVEESYNAKAMGNKYDESYYVDSKLAKEAWKSFDTEFKNSVIKKIKNKDSSVAQDIYRKYSGERKTIISSEILKLARKISDLMSSARLSQKSSERMVLADGTKYKKDDIFSKGK